MRGVGKVISWTKYKTLELFQERHRIEAEAECMFCGGNGISFSEGTVSTSDALKYKFEKGVDEHELARQSLAVEMLKLKCSTCKRRCLKTVTFSADVKVPKVIDRPIDGTQGTVH